MKKLKFKHLEPLEFHFLNEDENRQWHDQPEQRRVGIDRMEPITILNCCAIGIAANICMEHPEWEKIYWKDRTRLDWPHLGNAAVDRFIHRDGSDYDYFKLWFDKDQFKDFFNSFGEAMTECLKENPDTRYPFIAVYDAEERRYLFSEEEEKLKKFW